MDQELLKVKILSPTQTIFEGEAVSLSSVNSSGKFDILPFHANFITLVQNQPLLLRVKKNGTGMPASLKKSNGDGISKAFESFFKENIKVLKYQFDIAIIFTKENLVTVYTNIQPQF